MKTDTTTAVIFRRYPDDQIIALFPYIAENRFYVLSYMHLGQHSGAYYPEVINSTKPATPEQYKPLADELTVIGYNLQVIKRAYSRKMYK